MGVRIRGGSSSCVNQGTARCLSVGGGYSTLTKTPKGQNSANLKGPRKKGSIKAVPMPPRTKGTSMKGTAGGAGGYKGRKRSNVGPGIPY